MAELGLDPGFVGDAYAAPDLLQDAQVLINWYCEVSQSKNAKMPIALLGCPGLNAISSLQMQTGAVRGAWVLPGGSQALFVTGNTLYLASVTVPATQTSIAQFSLTTIGTLLTTNGPVIFRDNGVIFGGQGGYAVLVDGLYGYYYALSGTTTTVTFTGGVTNGSSSISLPSALPTGLLIGAGTTLSDVAGYIPAGTNIASINYNTPSITMTANATGLAASDTISLSIPTFGRITDPGFPTAPSRLAFIEGWLIVNQVGTRTFQTNGPTAYTMTWPGSFFALKDSSTDNLVTLYENNRELWLVGERTSEVWYNAGGATFAFQRIPGIGPQVGTSAQHSITRLGPQLAFLGKNEQGENMVLMTNQYAFERISTHAIEHAISQYPQVSDAISYAYEEEGHVFLMLIFPTADVCWCFDATSRMWHQRLSYNSSTGQFHRHLSNCFVNLQDLRLVGDYQSGAVYQMSRNFYSDNGAVLKCQRRAPHVWSKENRKRVFQSSMQIEFTPGVGLQTGQGSNPQAMLRWSDDGGFTWSNEHWATIGAVGRTRNRAMWRRLGHARDRVYELNYTDPTVRDIIGATLFAEAEEEVQA